MNIQNTILIQYYTGNIIEFKNRFILEFTIKFPFLL